MIELSKINKKYQLIYADPPWQYKDVKAGGGSSGAAKHYKTLTILDLMRLRVDMIADENCLLAMWHVGPMPQEAIDVVKLWGFKLKTMKGFTWHKLTKTGLCHFGMGHYTRANTEDCLIAIKGRPEIKSHSVRQFIETKIQEHSRKPDEVRDLLVELCGDVPRIELFARRQYSGWDAWGNEV